MLSFVIKLHINYYLHVIKCFWVILGKPKNTIKAVLFTSQLVDIKRLELIDNALVIVN